MRWNPGGVSSDIEDRRGGGGGFGGFRMGGGGGLGIGGILLALVLSVIFGQDFFSVIGGGGGAPATATRDRAADAREEPLVVNTISPVLDDAQAFWSQQLGPRYERSKLVLFRDAVRSGCGMADSATGPFYCPADQKMYVDLSFFDELDRRFGAPGDFAQAYVLAHELGHHVQHQLGIDRQMRQMQGNDPQSANQLSVQMELQADCLAGVWGRSAAERGHLEPGDAEEGLRAAAAIGDDRLQRMSGRGIRPESWTHGSSEQRMTALRRGLDSGDPRVCLGR